MRWRNRHERIANSITDPLERRIYIRSQREHRRRAASDAFWELSWSSGTLSGKAFAAVPFYLFFGLLWAIVGAILEELRQSWRSLRDWTRKRRFKRYERQARTSRQIADPASHMAPRSKAAT